MAGNLYRLTFNMTDGTKQEVEFEAPQGEAGKDGNGIKSAILNADYTLTLTFDDDTTYTTPSIRGEKGEAGETPVKGTDYFTDEDKTEIAEDAAGLVDTSDFASKTYLIGVFEELKAALEDYNAELAIAVLDRAILDMSTLA